jgi:NAD+ kinase
MGRLGFITELELEEIGRLEEILEGQYTLEKRMMLDVEVRREGELVFTGFGLNEAVVSRTDPAHAIRLTAYGDNRKISDYAGDGIIIATPTGSTAYSMAAGGPIVEPTAENLILTPLCAHSLTAKAYVLTGDRRTSVKLLKADGNDAQLLIDGRDRFPLLVGDLIYVRKSELYCRLVKVMDRSFYEIVKNKLNQ